MSTADRELAQAVLEALDGVRDACMVAAGLDLSVRELGLVRDVECSDDGQVRIRITFTEPGCPFTHHMLHHIHEAVERVPGIAGVRVQPVWDPPWTEDWMSETARRQFRAARRRMAGGATPLHPMRRRHSAAGND
ncbi:MAG TPA: metal-sulfur cluster assembly factor [Gammaproteobacteria bacterium]|nr:metal-sulfur cluster assembly factor [Gammaproteobacteria bacterium]